MIEKLRMRERSMGVGHHRAMTRGDPPSLPATPLRWDIGRWTSPRTLVPCQGRFGEFEDHVANIKSQKKRIRTNAKAAERNKAVKSELKTRMKSARTSIGSEKNTEDVRLAVKRIDMAAAKGIIHKNAAARRKSRLMKKVNAAG